MTATEIPMVTKNINFDIDEDIYNAAKAYLDTHKFTDTGEIEFATPEDFLAWRLTILAQQ
jgi:hypothetical protein